MSRLVQGGWLWVVLGGAGALLGAHLAWKSRRALALLRARLSDNLARSEAQLREQTRLVSRLRAEQRTLYSLTRCLPGIVRDLNRSDLDPRDIPHHLFRLADAVFEPERIVLFAAAKRGEEAGSPGEMRLVHQRGLNDLPESSKRVGWKEGKIGWVAANLVEMTGEDWLRMTRNEGRTIEDNHPDLRLDLLGPLVHHGIAGQTTVLGVLGIDGPRVRPRDEKLMLQMITNLGSIAYMNTNHVAALQNQANHDGLTGLLNKTFFMRRLGELMNVAEKRNRPLAVFMFDIDCFKKYNDLNGHPAGDELLKSVAHLVRENLRPGDLVSRYGGEEFVVAMPQTDAPTAFDTAERIRTTIAEHDFPHGNSQPGGRLTISGGVAAFPVDGRSSTELIMHADQALYHAKGDGRNRIARFEAVLFGGDDDSDFGDTAPVADAGHEPGGSRR